MARRNDILFTKKSESGINPLRRVRLPSRVGLFQADFSGNGIVAAEFLEASVKAKTEPPDPASRDFFFRWLEEFEAVGAAERRWSFLDLRGTAFQLLVWQALLGLSSGARCGYAAIARQIGRPGAWRAVGTAVGANPVALVVPCHRVLPARGGFGNYRWGRERKQALLDVEAASASSLRDLFL